MEANKITLLQELKSYELSTVSFWKFYLIAVNLSRRDYRAWLEILANVENRRLSLNRRSLNNSGITLYLFAIYLYFCTCSVRKFPTAGYLWTKLFDSERLDVFFLSSSAWNSSSEIPLVQRIFVVRAILSEISYMQYLMFTSCIIWKLNSTFQYVSLSEEWTKRLPCE